MTDCFLDTETFQQKCRSVESKEFFRAHHLHCQHLDSSRARQTLGGSDEAWCKVEPEIPTSE